MNNFLFSKFSMNLYYFRFIKKKSYQLRHISKKRHISKATTSLNSVFRINFDIHIYFLYWGTVDLQYYEFQVYNTLIQTLKRLYSIWNYYSILEGLPGSPVVKTPCFHCRGHGFDPWSKGTKIRMLHSTAKKRKENTACISLAVNKFLYFIHSTLYLLISYLYLAPLPYPFPTGNH